MPAIQAISGLNRSIATQNSALSEISRVQDAMIRVGKGPVKADLMQTYTANTTRFALAKTFIPYWVEQLKVFFEQLKLSNSIAFGSK